MARSALHPKEHPGICLFTISVATLTVYWIIVYEMWARLQKMMLVHCWRNLDDAECHEPVSSSELWTELLDAFAVIIIYGVLPACLLIGIWAAGFTWRAGWRVFVRPGFCMIYAICGFLIVLVEHLCEFFDRYFDKEQPGEWLLVRMFWPTVRATFSTYAFCNMFCVIRIFDAINGRVRARRR
ncbi:unnamed protein product, partial [Mesorhabditis spiculigera]